MELREDMTVYVLMDDKGGFVTTMELSTRRSWTYAFTSQEKAASFLRTVRQSGFFKTIKRVLPCTLAEYFEMQKKRDLPDVTIDPDPVAIRDYSMKMMVSDASKQNVSCLTTTAPDGSKVYKVAVSPRTDG